MVVSAVNFSQGGPLTVLIDCLRSATEVLGSEWRIVALVHDKQMIRDERVQCIAYPQAKRSWLQRLWLEWFGFDDVCRQYQPDLWLSLHDITPRVRARRQAVYCHNPAPFYRLTVREAWLEPTLLLFNWFYGSLYGVNIQRNHAVVVQQGWLRDEFRRRYGHSTVLVAHPSTSASLAVDVCLTESLGRTVFLYPALPRVFKNIELLCEAVALLPAEISRRIEMRFTLDGTENRYARELVRRFSAVTGVRFLGRQGREQMAKHYAEADVILFPSKLETWGLPITEAKALGKSLLVADLPYAHETVGSYEKVSFLSVSDAAAWSQAIAAVAEGRWRFAGHTGETPAEPYAADWPQLWQLLTEGL